MIISKSSKESENKDGNSIPIEDIGCIIIDNPAVIITQYLLSALNDNNAAIIICNDKHMPASMLLNLDGNCVQSERFKSQIEAKKPLIKKLWQQTVISKITNQKNLLKKNNVKVDNMKLWIRQIKTGDRTNIEARASVFYWKNLFKDNNNFVRDRFGEPPNNLLNYGYSILRGIVARALVSSGLLPTLGIHHKNKYNAYCLADDIMEPYRPYVDELVLNLKYKYDYELTKDIKRELLKIPVIDIAFHNEKSPLMVGIQRTTSSLAKCYLGESDTIIYPILK
jgi:CRISPR-associated protein Cas1